MWILSFLPFWIFHLIVFAGIAAVVCSFVLKFIPFISTYTLPIQLIGIVLISFGLFFEGAASNEQTWLAKVKEVETKIVEVEVKSVQENVKIVTKYVDRIKVVKETTDAIIKEIPVYITKADDAKCELPNTAIVLHDSSSQNAIPPSTGNITPGASDVKASELITTVIENYGTYYEVREQLKAWQEWYRIQKKVYEAISK
jgi:hypothetical protein